MSTRKAVFFCGLVLILLGVLFWHEDDSFSRIFCQPESQTILRGTQLLWWYGLHLWLCVDDHVKHVDNERWKTTETETNTDSTRKLDTFRPFFFALLLPDTEERCYKCLQQKNSPVFIRTKRKNSFDFGMGCGTYLDSAVHLCKTCNMDQATSKISFLRSSLL